MKPAVVAAAVLIAAVLIIVPVLFVQYRTVDVVEQRSVPWTEDTTELGLHLAASLGVVEVGFEDLDGAAVEITARVQGTASHFGDKSPLDLRLEYGNATDGRLDVVARFNTYAPQPYYSLHTVRYEVLVDTDLPTELNITVTTGGATVLTTEGTVLNGLRLNATTLGATVALNNGTVLAGDMRVRSATGGAFLYWNNVTVVGDRRVLLEESSGKVFARVNQLDPMGGAVAVVSEDRAGATELVMDIHRGVSATVEGTSVLGPVELTDEGGFSGTPTALRSANYPTAMRFDVRLNSTVGGIEAWCRWSS